jgi:hypothetical protein
MSYNVYKTNGEKLITVLDGTATGETLDTKYSLTFIGKNYPNYGRIQQENFLKLLESKGFTFCLVGGAPRDFLLSKKN